MNFSNLNDEQLAEHLNEVIAEQERRQDLESIPSQIKELTAKFIEGGGDPEDLE